MADRDRTRNRHRDEEGFIARRGFGNERSGGREERESRGYDRRYDEARERDFGDHGRRERDFGDSAGYGSGGSARDWRDVMGEERGYGGFFGAGPHRGRDESRFGRGSREEDDERGFFSRAGDEVRSWLGDDEAERRRMRDARMGDTYAQHHRGRGPKNYQRSDERIRDDVNDRLTDDPHVDATEIEVSVANREVTLAGTVNSRFEKRHAEDIAESVSGVAHVQNNLRVMEPGGIGSAGEQGSRTIAPAAPGSTFARGSSPGPRGTGLGGGEVGARGETAGRTRRR